MFRPGLHHGTGNRPFLVEKMTHAEKAIRNEQMRKYIETHTTRETAEAFGMTESTVCTICKDEISRKPRVYHGGKFLKGRHQDTEKIIAIIEQRQTGVEYAGNYTGTDGTVDLRCTCCGNVFTRSWVTVRHKNIRCDACYGKSLREKEEARAAEKAARQAEEEKARWNRAMENATQLTFKVCKECGNIFVPEGNVKTYCSDKCRKRALNNHKDRRLKGKEKDPSITLQKVFSRDGGICYLCGGRCDWSDYERKDGKKIAGNNYPSIDHVIPLAHNGTHTWDNVRLAHRWCNTMKSDSPL